MKIRPCLVLVGILAVFGPGCGNGDEPDQGGDSQGGTATAERIPLGNESGGDDGGHDAGQGGSSEVVEISPTKPSVSEQGPDNPAPKPPPQSTGGNALKLIHRWHRSPISQREAALVGVAAAQAQALREFHAIWEGGAAAYQASLQLEVPTSLGPEFQKHAQAFASGGVDALGDSLHGGSGPVWMAWMEALALRANEKQNHPMSCLALASVLRSMLQAGYDRERVLSLRDPVASVSRYASDYLPFELYEVQPNDSLIGIAYRFRRDKKIQVRHGWIQTFNDKASDRIRVGEEIKVPTQALHMEVWRQARIAALFSGSYLVRLYSVSVGRKGADETPLGSFSIETHDPQPTWYRKDGPPLPYGNKDNALGERWLGFKERTSYGLHGTNSEETIGSFETQGCVRFHNSDIIEIYDMLPVGTKVQIHG
ncbi:MAG: hypothetical protein DWQ01_14545 [Planctomycetota bacterium]|nr:MAG: hypothetical protein DWQ01_14545 [Planctomycetota bacterium]